jgi:hypothetical protein
MGIECRNKQAGARKLGLVSDGRARRLEVVGDGRACSWALVGDGCVRDGSVANLS